MPANWGYDSKTSNCDCTNDCSKCKTTATINNNPNLTINSDGISFNTTKTKTLIDGEEITGEDIQFIHGLEKNFKEIGNASYDCSSAMLELWNAINPFTSDYAYSYQYPSTLTYTGNFSQEKRNEMNLTKNFNFGPCGDRAKISHLGIAVQNSNSEWVSYDKENNEIVNVDLINFGGNNFVYMVPVALKDVSEGDAVIHNRHVMFVTKAREKFLQVIDVTDGEIKKILPTKSVFGFDFITKIVSIVDFTASTANEDNPFGNILPFLLLNDNDKGNNMLPLAFMLMSKDGKDGGLFSSSISSTQMMLMAMMNNGQGYDQNFLPLMFLMNENTKRETS